MAYWVGTSGYSYKEWRGPFYPPDVADNASANANADELLRYDGTAQMVVRHTHDAVELGDVTIPAGQTVFAIIGSANHDPAEFSEPDHIDVSRGRFRPMRFGGGAHFCLGASLARLEGTVAVAQLIERLREPRLAGMTASRRCGWWWRRSMARWTATRPSCSPRPRARMRCVLRRWRRRCGCRI